MRKRVYMHNVKAKEQCNNPDCRRVWETKPWLVGYTPCPYCNWPPAQSEKTLTEDADERAELARERLEAEEGKR